LGNVFEDDVVRLFGVGFGCEWLKVCVMKADILMDRNAQVEPGDRNDVVEDVRVLIFPGHSRSELFFDMLLERGNITT
jgi:hypothetical protein